MLELHVLEFARMHCGHHLVPEHAAFHHVALFHRGDLVAALARELEGHARNALDLVGVVDLRIDGALLAVAEIGDGLRLAEINAAGELAQDHDVEAFDQFALERRGVGQSRIGHRRAQIGVEREILAQAQKPRFRPHLIRHAVPFRPADRAEQDRVGGLRLGHGLVGDRDLVRVVAAAADQPFLGREPGDALVVEESDQLFDLGHDFGADAVAGRAEAGGSSTWRDAPKLSRKARKDRRSANGPAGK